MIDDVVIWNRTLSDEEIKLLNNSITNILGSQETLLNEVWQANVTINDGVNDSAPVESNYLQIVNVCVTDTCTYSSGNWNLNCADNCQITSNVNVGNNNIYFTNAGNFYIKANISRYGLIDISDNCNLVFYNSGGFR